MATDDAELAERVRHLTSQVKDDPIEHRHEQICYNYRLTSVKAAIGVAQLEQLEEYLAVKQRISQRYREAFVELPGIEPQPIADYVDSTHWLFTVLMDEGEFGMESRALMIAWRRRRPRPTHCGRQCTRPCIASGAARVRG